MSGALAVPFYGGRLAIDTAAHQHLDPSGGGYVVICETHHTTVNVSTRIAAWNTAPLDFCEQEREGVRIGRCPYCGGAHHEAACLTAFEIFDSGWTPTAPEDIARAAQIMGDA